MHADDLKSVSKDTAESKENDKTSCSHQGLMNKYEENMNHSGTDSMFQVVPIKLYGREGVINDYALLDTASSVTMMDRSLYEEAGLQGVDDVLRLRWTGNVTRSEKCKRVSIVISGNNSRSKHELQNVYVRETLALGAQSCDIKKLQNRYKHLRGLPLEGMLNITPRILFGVQHSKLLATQRTIEGNVNEPVATKTTLGWVVFGPTIQGLEAKPVGCHLTTVMSLHHGKIPADDEQLHEEVKKFFSTEAFGVTPGKQCLSRDDKRALEIIDATMKKVGNVFEIGLLWKSDNIRLPDSYSMARRRLEADEKSLRKHGRLEWKNREISSLLEKGYARVATAEDLTGLYERVWTTPHFVVANTNKIPPKLRNVMDVAAEFRGTSLNKNLLKGPENMAPLFAGLFRLREHEIALNADVKEFFNRFKIIKADQQCQRFLWRDGDISRPPTVYIHDSMMFGPTCSPSCATEIKNRHAALYLEKFPEAADALINSTYVDDFFTSQPTLEKAYEVMSQAIEICKEMSADLVGIQSNSQELIAKFPTSHVKQKLVAFDSVEGEDFVTKVLGLHWIPKSDHFTFVLRESEALKQIDEPNFKLTKRMILSEVMKIFDPLGFVTKYTLQGKLMLQEIWRAGATWDEDLVSHFKEKWRGFVASLRKIATLKIPRFYAQGMPECAKIELVIFVDASEVAFAAVGYLRFEAKGGHVHVSQVMAKARVAPIKPLSIPQLELQAAVLGVRIAETIQKLHTLKIERTIFLTDSTCVQHWISSKTMKFKSFVRVRIGEILETTNQNQWYHVRTHENVADEATRPIDNATCDVSDRWYQGPSWMREKLEEWPVSNLIEEADTSEQAMLMIHQPKEDGKTFEFLERVSARFKSTWGSYCRVIGWARRFVNTRLRQPHECAKFINKEEFEQAQKNLFRRVQHDEWEREVVTMKNSGKVSNDSNLVCLNPFLAPDGLIRASTRAQKVEDSYGSRNPVILPNKHELVDLFLEYHHRRNLHIRDETVIASIRETAWIIHVRRALKRVKSNFCFCRLKKVIRIPEDELTAN